MKRSLFLLLFLLTFLLTSFQQALADYCIELNWKLKNHLLNNTDYRIAFLDTFRQSDRKKILEKTNDQCPGLIKLDPSVEAFGVVLQDINTNDYHVFHAVKCDCKGGPGWRIAKFAEFSDDIPIIKTVTEEAVFDSQANRKIIVGSQWKAMSVELLNSGERFLYRKNKTKVVKNQVKANFSKSVKTATDHRYILSKK